MESRQYTFNNSTLTVKFGNILDTQAEVIVSSDDCYVTMGGGVSRTILHAGGDVFIRDAQKMVPIPLGDVLATTAALIIYKRLAEDDPQVYKSYLAVDYINIAYTSILSKQFAQAELYSFEALKVDSTKYFANTNLALAYFLQGKYADAEKIYIQYKSEFKNDFLNDIESMPRLA